MSKNIKLELNESLTLSEIISLALREEDDEIRWRYVQTLHIRGGQEIFETALILCKSQNPLDATLGADILGQLGTPDFPFHESSVPVLLEIFDNHEEENPLQAATMALGRTQDSRAVKKLLELKNHESAEIRFAVVHGLLTIEDEESVKALIELSMDEDEDVRNWATFGLGSQIEIDTPEIRDPLFNRLDEDDPEIRGEALIGLALRKDERVLIPLLKELTSKNVGTLRWFN
jgi:HEAT repeat protein